MQASVFSFSLRGAELSKKVSKELEIWGYSVINLTSGKYAHASGLKPMVPDHKAACAAAFSNSQIIVFIGAAGIAVRTIAPFICSKSTDPAVLVIDEKGNYVIPILSGHIGGANQAARMLALVLNAKACITTATDVNGLFAVDEWAARNNMEISSLKDAKEFAAALVAGREVGFFADANFSVVGTLPKQVVKSGDHVVGMAVTLNSSLRPFPVTVRLLPRIVHLGIGCRRNTTLEAIEGLVLSELDKLHLDLRCVAGIASVDLKKDESGLLAFAAKYKLKTTFYTATELNAVVGDFSTSAFVQKVVGVSNVCERSAVLASGEGDLLLRKTAQNGVTLAVAAEKVVLKFTDAVLK